MRFTYVAFLMVKGENLDAKIISKPGHQNTPGQFAKRCVYLPLAMGVAGLTIPMGSLERSDFWRVTGSVSVQSQLNGYSSVIVTLVIFDAAIHFEYILFVSILHFFQGTGKIWARYITLNERNHSMCIYIISKKILDSDSQNFTLVSCENQGAFVPNMLLGALVGRLFGGLLESAHLQVEVLDETSEGVANRRCKCSKS